MASFLSSLFCCCSYPGKATTNQNTMEKQEKDRPLPTKGAPSKRQISNPMPPNHKKSAAASTVSAQNNVSASPTDSLSLSQPQQANPLTINAKQKKTVNGQVKSGKTDKTDKTDKSGNRIPAVMSSNANTANSAANSAANANTAKTNSSNTNSATNTATDSATDSTNATTNTPASNSANNPASGNVNTPRTRNKQKSNLITKPDEQTKPGPKKAARCESTPPVAGPRTPASVNTTGSSSRHQANASMGHIPMEYVTPDEESDKEVAIKGRRHSVPLLSVGHATSGDAYDHSNNSNINNSSNSSNGANGSTNQAPPLPTLSNSANTGSSAPATRSSSVSPLSNSNSVSAQSSLDENARTSVYEVNPDQYTQSSLMMSTSYDSLAHLPGHTLLPDAEPEVAGRKCLVLDLDETLVHSSFKYLWNADFVIPVEIEGMWHDVYVVKRPGVDEFLQRVSEMYEVVVFTASVAKYGDPLLDYLDASNVVHHRLFRESCTNKNGIYVKELGVLGRPLENVIIIDNSPAAYSSNPHNAIPVSSWFSDVHDSELMDMIPFLEDLASDKVPDVINVLRTEW